MRRLGWPLQQILKATHAVDDRVRGVRIRWLDVDNRVAGVDDRVASVDDRVVSVDDRVKVASTTRSWWSLMVRKHLQSVTKTILTIIAQREKKQR